MTEIVSRKDFDTLTDLFLDFGEMMLDAGAEISRVEDSISRMGKAYGAVQTNVFVITSSIVITMVFKNGEKITQTRRILSSGGTDFKKLESLNNLSRECCQSTITLEELNKKIHKIGKDSVPILKQYIGSVLAAGGFAVFFGGTVFDGFAAGLFALLVCLLQNTFSKVSPNRVFFCFVCSFVTGMGICILNKYVSFIHTDKIMIGDIMLIIPGISITNAVRDMLIGETIAGTMRLLECLVWTGGLAAGFMIAMRLGGMM